MLLVQQTKIEKKINKLKRFNLSYFSGNFSNYLVFQPALKYFKMSGAKSNQIIALKSNVLLEESIKSLTTSNNSLTPEMTF